VHTGGYVEQLTHLLFLFTCASFAGGQMAGSFEE
jgi:hypothetical protein